MNGKQYAEFEGLLPPLGSVPDLETISKRLRVPYDVLSAAYAQAAQQQSWENHLKAKPKLPVLFERYKAGESLAALARTVELPPCLLVRRFLEFIPEAYCLKGTHVLRNPKLLEGLSQSRQTDAEHVASGQKLYLRQAHEEQQGPFKALMTRLQADIAEASEQDTISSPQADLMRSVVGQEYEALLSEKLHCAGIAFFSEDKLRKEGFFKTPDVKLEVPVLMHGQVVTWMDSKAMFGSERYHMQQQDTQYAKYLNRFGPGAIIYWFGFCSELAATNPNILVLDSFPDGADIVQLRQLALRD